jgi:hypothetical protein
MLIPVLICWTGDGRTTRIWEDNWMPHDSSMRPTSSLKINPLILVSDLIFETTTLGRVDWSVSSFYRCMPRLFWEFCYAHEDKMIFGHGILTEKVCPWYAQLTEWWWQKINGENYLEGSGGSSNSVSESKGWSALWKNHMPSKSRFFWRLAQQSLATTDLLEHRHMSR